jgi:carboxymethylenebutenolidase
LGSFVNLTAADGHRFRAYAAGAADQRRGLVVCHGHGGLNRHIRAIADRLAVIGFCVVAPALFDRAEPDLELSYTPADRARGRAAAAQIPIAQSMLDVTAAGAMLGRPATAILGYECGATVTWHAAAQLAALRAAVCFYGAGIAAAREATPLCPTQLHFSEFDDHISFADIEAVRHAQPSAAVEFYAGVAHGFACAEQESFHSGAAEAALDHTLVFLLRHMDAAPRARPAPQVAAPAETATKRWPYQPVAFGRRAFA